MTKSMNKQETFLSLLGSLSTSSLLEACPQKGSSVWFKNLSLIPQLDLADAICSGTFTKNSKLLGLSLSRFYILTSDYIFYKKVKKIVYNMIDENSK
jgi:hypothetical protein